MNLQEFAALKVGDEIKNEMSNGYGKIVTVERNGVRVCWLGAGRQEPAANAPTWHYEVNSTAWYHWSKVENVSQQSTPSETDPSQT